MKHTAYCLVLLAALAGCSSSGDCPQASRSGPIPRLVPDRPSMLPDLAQTGTVPGAMMTAKAGGPTSPYHQINRFPMVEPLRPPQFYAYANRPHKTQPATTPMTANNAPAIGFQDQPRSVMSVRQPAGPVQTVSGWQTSEPPVAEQPQLDLSNVPILNSRRIPFNFAVDKSNPNAANMQLWYTHDGGPWCKHPTPPPDEPPFTIDVEKDGVYGFCLAAYGPQGGPPPGPGEAPQLLVEVDTVEPEVRLIDIKTASPGEIGSVTIYWQARDKNLDHQGIALLWAEDAEGPWKPIITQYENTGFFEWRLPAGLPPRFCVKVEATDDADNIGVAETPGPIVLDASAPPPAKTSRTLVESAPKKAGIKAIETEAPKAIKPGITLELTDEP